MHYSTRSNHAKPLLQQAARHIQACEYAQAMVAIEEHLKSSAYDAQAWAQRALVLILTGQEALALDAANIAIKIDRKNSDAWSMQGSALMQLGRFDEALLGYEQVAQQTPGSAVAHYNKGNALRRMGRLDDAIASIEKSLVINPNYTNALSVMGSLQQAKGNLNEALQLFDNALKIEPKAADAHYNRALLHLATENFEAGWQDYEWRLNWDVAIRQGQSRAVDRLAPDWDGQPTDLPILVVPEQGVGDQIFYGGMLCDLQKMVPGSTVCLIPRLIALFARSFPHLNFVTPDYLNSHRADYSDQFSAQIHLASLGKFFRKNPQDFRHVVGGYLTVDHPLKVQLRNKLSHPQKIVCGVSWRSKNHEFGNAKSLTLDALAPLLALPDVAFVDLQYGDTSNEIQDLHTDHGLAIAQVEGVDKFQDIDALAALISACDIVVTVSNTTAHLAAALGKPVVVMLPNSPSLFWYWHLTRADSPWYPSAVLLRQTVAGEWSDVVSTAETALREFTKAAKP